MNKRSVYFTLVMLALCLLLNGCISFTPQPDIPPEQVVTRFYRWYIGYPGNPLVDREYRYSPYLSAGFIDEIDATLDDFALGGADPILLAQDIPASFSIEQATTSDDQAQVDVHFYWGGNPTPSPRQIDLVRVNGQWVIDGVSIPED